MMQSRFLRNIALMVPLVGCSSVYIPPSASTLDLMQATRMDDDATQVGGTLLRGEQLAVGARKTFGMGRDGLGGDVGLKVGLAHIGADGGLWIDIGERSAMRLGVTGGTGQHPWSKILNDEYEYGPLVTVLPYGGGSVHFQHPLGEAKKGKAA